MLAGSTKRARHFLDLEELQDIAFSNLVVALDVQAALEVLTNLFRIILEALELFELTGKDYDVVTQNA